jgi:lipopolysaccharide transport system ATP-binding protein
MSSEVLIEAERVSKKFCRSLHRSLWYGVRDVGSTLLPWGQRNYDEQTGEFDLPTLRRDEFWAVSDVSFQLRRGECLGVIGHNGAGKSTLLKLLNSLIAPDTGRITTRGRVASIIELNAGFNPILTGRENIYNQAALLGFSPRETASKFDSIVDFAEMGEFLDMPVQNYSTGMAMKLGFAVAAHLEPDVLIIDEVLAVGDVAFRFKCLNAIGELMRSAAVVFVSHAMPNIFRVCTEVMVLDHGRPTFHGRNIADGVSAYLSLFKERERSHSGSGEVELVSLRTSGPVGAIEIGETLRIGFGDCLTVTAEFRASQLLTQTRIQFVLWNAEMLPVLDIMSPELEGYLVDIPPSGGFTVSAKLPHVVLNGGKYTMSVIAESRDHDRTYCRYDNSAYLDVEAATTSGALVLSTADWVTRPL